MKDIKEAIRSLASSIGREVKLMEVCGTHTAAIFRHGLRGILPHEIALISGPGCPVCVTSIKDVDTAIAISRLPGVTLATFGDMMGVPGAEGSLYTAKAGGSDIRVVYSPLDALDIAGKEKGKNVVFFATGFETTSPSIGATILEAERRKIKNFFIYSVHKTIPPALKALLDFKDISIDGFILPGHVSAIIGSLPYEFIARDYGKPSVITGFEAEDILEAILLLLRQRASGKAAVEIQYGRAVKEDGNLRALSIIDECFKPCDARWRGIGVIPGSGLGLREKFMHRDAKEVFGIDVPERPEPKGCMCGDVMRGVRVPTECPLFGKKCLPETPVGACMVSMEGSCAVYYRFGGPKVG
jgi:hydrogenase expression/formation protein HypD